MASALSWSEWANADGKIRPAGTAQDALQGFAEGIESLIGVCGHSQSDVWRMTPRQVFGYLSLASKRIKREMGK